jgi:hypothetical protein
MGTAFHAAEKYKTEGGGGFNPRIMPIKSTRALAPEGSVSPILPAIPSFPAACLAVPLTRQKYRRALAPAGKLKDGQHSVMKQLLRK